MVGFLVVGPGQFFWAVVKSTILTTLQPTNENTVAFYFYI